MTRLRLFIPWALCIVLALGLAWTTASLARYHRVGESVSRQSYTTYYKNLEALQARYGQAEGVPSPVTRRQLVLEAGEILAVIDQEAQALNNLRTLVSPRESGGEWHLRFQPARGAAMLLLKLALGGEEIETAQLQQAQTLLLDYRRKLPDPADPTLFEQLSKVHIRR